MKNKDKQSCMPATRCKSYNSCSTAEHLRTCGVPYLRLLGSTIEENITL